MIIAISGSGNSKNVVNAARYGRENNAKVIGFLGFDGGKLEQIVDTKIIIPARHYGIVEDAHLVLSHLLSNHLREKIEKGE